MTAKTKRATRERLHRLVDELDDARARALLTVLKDAPAGSAMAPGKDPTSADDPLWEIVGMVGDEYDGPTNVSSNKYRYIAEHSEIKVD